MGVKPPAITKCVRAALEAARATLSGDYAVSVEHGGRHAVHLHVTHLASGALWRVPVPNGGKTNEQRAGVVITTRCRQIMAGRWGCPTG